MNLKEKLADAQARFVECAEGIKAGDADVIAKAEGIKAEIETIKADIETAEKGAALLAAMGNDKPEQVKGEQPKTLGAYAAKHLDVAGIKGRHGASVSVEYKGTQTALNTSIQDATVSRTVVDRIGATPIRDAFGSETIDGNAYTWAVMGNVSPETAALVAEGGKKPELAFIYGQITEPLKKYAGWFKDTDELLSDNAYLASAIENRGVYRLRKVVENALASYISDAAKNGMSVTRDGSPVTIPAADSVLIPAASVSTMTASDLANYIYNAVANVKAASGADCDAVILSTQAAMMLRTGRDGNGQYYGGGYFQQAYGQGEGYSMMPNLWGMRVMVSDAIGDAAMAVVGNFAQGATVISKRDGGVRVEATNSNEDDFVHDLVTVRLEERMLLAVREPAMFAGVFVAS